MIAIKRAQFHEAPPLYGFASPASGSVVALMDGEWYEFLFEADFARVDTDLEVTGVTFWYADEFLEAGEDEAGEFFGTDQVRVARADFESLVDTLTFRIEAALGQAAEKARRAYAQALEQPL